MSRHQLVTLLLVLSPLLLWLAIFFGLGPIIDGHHRWHERYTCSNCRRVTKSQHYPKLCPSCGSPAERKPIVVRWVMPFAWEQLDEDEARTGIKAKPTSIWSRLFGPTP